MSSLQNFRVLCYTLVVSRVLLFIQYSIILAFTLKKGYGKLYLPLVLSVLIFAAAAAIFTAMTPAFKASSDPRKAVYAVWWIVILFEGIFVIAISSIWRTLSFKKTHIVERMGLLTLIVIGEGAIGVTKTISRIMGKHGLDSEGCGLIFCIILILVCGSPG